MVLEMVDETYAAFVAKLSPRARASREEARAHAEARAHRRRPVEPRVRARGDARRAGALRRGHAGNRRDRPPRRGRGADLRCDRGVRNRPWRTDQVAATPEETGRLVAEVRRARDAAALRDVCQGRKGADTDFLRAHERTLTAIATERRFFNEDRAVTFETYERDLARKAERRFPADARAGPSRTGWGTERTRAPCTTRSLRSGSASRCPTTSSIGKTTSPAAARVGVRNRQGRDPRVARGEDLDADRAVGGPSPDLAARGVALPATARHRERARCDQARALGRGARGAHVGPRAKQRPRTRGMRRARSSSSGGEPRSDVSGRAPWDFGYARRFRRRQETMTAAPATSSWRSGRTPSRAPSPRRSHRSSRRASPSVPSSIGRRSSGYVFAPRLRRDERI